MKMNAFTELCNLNKKYSFRKLKLKNDDTDSYNLDWGDLDPPVIKSDQVMALFEWAFHNLSDVLSEMEALKSRISELEEKHTRY